MKTTRLVSNTGVPVICTIHQPSKELFLLFDSLLLLRPGGRVIYFGDLGDNADTVLTYFKKFGLECHDRKNPADFVLDCSGAGIGGGPNETKDDPYENNIINIDQEIDDENGDNEVKNAKILSNFDGAEIWRNSNELEEVDEYLSELSRENSQKKGQGYISPTGFTKIYATSVFTQIKLSMIRSVRNKFRQPTSNRSYLITYIFMGVILGWVYFQQDNTQTGARNRVSLIYFIIVFQALGAIASIPNLILQRSIYYREKPAFLRPFAYFVASVVAEIPLVLIATFIMGSILYFMVGLNPGTDYNRFFYFLLVFMSSSLACVSFAMAVAACVATTEVANTFVGLGSTLFSLFAGFIIPRLSIPKYIRFVHYISFYTYPLEALAINEFNGLNLTCSENEYIQIHIDPNDYNITKPYCPYQNGTFFLEQQFTMHSDFEWFGIDVGILWIFVFFFIFITYFGIKNFNHLTR
eukprot:TRINITY_DN239_c4_g1_i1.p1 TRINITY_DN239_c4_g1~~TRINITY_DN239_c4_g1_i1.p1  ORF type:complete len:467 (-),score=145.58 TRINITY_DN239_c4_g1_i1:119-1519(-)